MTPTSYYLITKELILPLDDMTSALQQIQAGVWEAKFQVPNRVEEIESVRKTINVMLKEIKQYKIQAYETKIEKQKIQLQYFQLQLAPHFYTNCLKNVYYMLMLKEYENVEQFLLCLSVHLRYLLQKDKPKVTIREEVKFVLNYVELQKQMTTKLFCEVHAEEDIQKYEIPILMLQTFVENAVKYARSPQISELKISIQINMRKTEVGNYLDVCIRDNGSGYPAYVLELLNKNEPVESPEVGVGIINLLNRMNLFYGSEASWYFENSGGAVSELIIPVQEDNDERFTYR